MSSLQTDAFVELERTFHDLRAGEGEGDNAELRVALLGGAPIGWDELIAEHRVVLLAEAGAGKTEEIRAAAIRLRREDRAAFFLRIEHLADHLADAFEVGDADAFDAWLDSSDEGWLLLDSVDEARLSSPKDFELAMRALARRIKAAMPRTHLIISGRTTAWRPKSDLLLCRSLFPYEPLKATAIEDEPGPGRRRTKGVDDATKPFRIVALDDLRRQQIERFLCSKGVNDAAAFLEAVERADAWSFTARPQDLEELAGFWISERRIGSRLEILRASIDRRLTERDPDRAEARPLPAERAREGARRVAAASTFARQPLIGVPDAADVGKALSIRKILGDWTEAECSALISRPIFDEAIYGSVRFHHRSVREYLTAEWLQSLLVRQGSRRRIEELFFREQYGIQVVAPAMRPILPWLVLLDEKILQRVMRLAPEVTFEGGDPSRLPADVRRKVLRQVCEQLAQPAHGRSTLDYAAVQRFAGADISEDIRSLLADYAEDDDIVWFLLRLVWHGELRDAAPEAKRVALRARERYARLAALKAVRTVGTAADNAEVREAILTEPETLLRDWLDEIVQGLPLDEDAVDWLARALEKVEPPEEFATDNLSDTLSRYIDGLPLELLAELTRSIRVLLGRLEPAERHDCQISKRYRWLGQFAVRAIARFIGARDPTVLEASMLTLLVNLLHAQAYQQIEMGEAPSELPQLIHAWPEMNDALFWASVAATRAERKETEPPLIDYWPVSIFGGRGWQFDGADFDRILHWVGSRPFMDDRRIALSLAFAVYVRSDRPRPWRTRMKKVVAGEPLLENDLQRFLHPPIGGRAKWREQERQWRRRRERWQARKLRQEERSRTFLQANLDLVRGPREGDGVTNAQAFLQQKMKDGANERGHWSTGNWESLIAEFGEEVARTFRDGAVAFWRQYRPHLLCEGREGGGTSVGVILGLTGLAIETREILDWGAGLSAADAEIAVRYALQELNGFPPWLPKIYARYPDIVADVFIREIQHELANDTVEGESYNLLYKVSWSGQWTWDLLGPMLLPVLADPPRNAANLRHVLKILQGSALPDETLASAVAEASKRPTDPTFTAMWFAAWVGVDPTAALNAFETYLTGLPDEEARTKIAMVFATNLLGSRRSGAASRQAFRKVQHLKRIFVILHTHVRRRDDIDRAGKGVYSPGLRDDAQDARDTIFALLKDIPGKEAYLALMELSLLHPDDSSRPWMAFHAKAKAEQDSDAAPWTTTQFVEFQGELERTPSNHRELWELALNRMLDLKDDLERGDTSIASILLKVEAEEELRNFVGGWCRERALGRYSASQEEELADSRRPDLRFLGAGFDAPVPIELKIADKWTGPRLFERLETQLCGDYLRDERSSRGLFVLIYRGTRRYWELTDGSKVESLPALVDALQMHWAVISDRYPGVEDVRVVGIDLEERGRRA